MAKENKKKTINNWFKKYEKQYNNNISLFGKVKNIFVDTDKVQKFSLEVPRKTEKENTAFSWVTVVNFDLDNPVFNDEVITVNGYVTTNSFNDKWSTEFVASEIIKH